MKESLLGNFAIAHYSEKVKRKILKDKKESFAFLFILLLQKRH